MTDTHVSHAGLSFVDHLPLLEALAGFAERFSEDGVFAYGDWLDRLGPQVGVRRLALFLLDDEELLRPVSRWAMPGTERSFASEELPPALSRAMLGNRIEIEEEGEVTAAIPVPLGGGIIGIMRVDLEVSERAPVVLRLCTLMATMIGSARGHEICVRKARDQARQMDHLQRMEAIGALTGGIAHDFNNLLMAMMGNISILLHEKERDDPEYMRLDSVRQFIISGSKLTRQLLRFARGEAHEHLSLDLNELIAGTSRLFARAHKEIQVKTFLGRDIAPIDGVKSQIEQAVMNLLVNAAQVLEPGGSIEVLTQNTEINEKQSSIYLAASGRYVEVIVKDTGPGMSKSALEHVFEPRFAGDGRGAGIGLASVYGVVKSHGGFCSVTSEEGRGTSFYLYFPVVREMEQHPVLLHSEPGTIVPGHEAVLLVDDEEIILKTAGSMLTKLGYQVILAESGREAVNRVREMGDAIDLIVMDMIMPDMDGVETFHQVRRLYPSIRVLLTSGYSYEGAASELMAEGCEGYLQKPYDINELSLHIREILDRPAPVEDPGKKV